MMRAVDVARSPRTRLILFGALYFAQGVPWGFVAVTLALYLTGEGLGPDAIGEVLALSYLPWTFKPLLGPLADKLDLGRFGRRRPWILAAEAGMGATLLVLAGVDPKTAMPLFLGLIFAHNVFAAAQDVGTDALAVELLGEHERGTANSVMWASKYAGVVVGGAGFSQIGRLLGWRWLFLIMAGLILAIAVLPLLTREPPRVPIASAPRAASRWSRVDWAIHAIAALLLIFGAFVFDLGQWTTALVFVVFVILFVVSSRTFLPGATEPGSQVITGTLRSFTLRATFFGLILVFMTEAGTGLLGPMQIPMLKNRIGLGDNEIGVLTGLVSSLSAVLGSLAGGILSDRIGRRRAVALFSALTALSYLAFGALQPFWSESIDLTFFVFRPAVHTFSVVSSIFEGMLQATMLSLCMDLSNPKVGGTQFTTFMAVSNAKSTWTAYVGGQAAAATSYPWMFSLAAGAQVAPLLLLLLVDPAEAARAFRGGSNPRSEQAAA